MGNWLSRQLKKTKQGSKLARWGKRTFKAPPSWRSWKPGRDKGLGLGKLLGGTLEGAINVGEGLLEAIPALTRELGSDWDPKVGYNEQRGKGYNWLDKIYDYSGEGQSLGGWASRLGEGTGWKDRHYLEQYLKGATHKGAKGRYGQDFGHWSNEEIFDILKREDPDEIRSLLSMMGVEDLGDTKLNYFLQNAPNILGQYEKIIKPKLEEMKSKWGEFGTNLAAKKRKLFSFGTGVDSAEGMSTLLEGLKTQYAGAQEGALSQIVREYLRMLEE